MKIDFTYLLLRVLRYYYYYYYYYYYCIFPGVSRIQLKKIKICGGPRDSGKIRSSSWSAEVCPGLTYYILTSLFDCVKVTADAVCALHDWTLP
jgi:hypothetical protein